MARQCSVCHYKLRFCTCQGRRASGDALQDRLSPLSGAQAKKFAPASLSRREHRKACEAQGWKAR